MIGMTGNRRLVYVLKSNSHPPHYYTGLTSDLRARLAEHNSGKCIATANNRPWKFDLVLKFADEGRAVAFERYLKSGSGNAFAIRHFR